jgi:hypothetical protein
VLEGLLSGAGVCDDRVLTAWEAVCASGDVDGDGAADSAYLVPLAGGRGVSPAPAAVVVQRTGAGHLDRFPFRDDADAGEIGRAMFSVAERTGEPPAELTFVSTRCGASNCVSRVEVFTWDGTAWRDVGPGEPGFDNPESIAWEGGELVVRAGALNTTGAGPTRVSTLRYALAGGVYVVSAVEPDPAVYLFHAMLDADRLFDDGRFREAIEAYAAAIRDTSLRDWKAEIGQREGRQTLLAYALFRIAVAAAAAGDDPMAAIDAVIIEGKEPLFAEAAQAFRRGYLDGRSVVRGCIEVTRYFSSPAAKALLEERFDYGYANPRKGPAEVCPL